MATRSKDSKSSSNDGNNKDKLVLYAAGPDNLVNDMVKQFEKQTGKSSSFPRYDR